jgi:ATP-binding cassette, subfamily B, multidrug efflux pump
MEVFKQLKQFYWKDRRFLFGSLLCLLTATALGLVYPNLLRYLIDDVITKEQYGKVPALSLFVIGVVATKGMFQFGSGFLGGRLGNRIAYNLREALYGKLQVMSFQYYDKARTGDLMSRLTQDLEAIRQFIAFGFPQIVNVCMMVVFGSAMMLSMNWKLTLLTLITMPFLVLTAIKFEGRIHPAFRSIRKSMGAMTTAAQENITGVRTVKSFARETHETGKFSGVSVEYKNNNIHAAKLWATYFPVMELFASLCIMILIGAGGYMVIHDEMLIGELVAFSSLIWYIIGPLWGVGFHINNYTQSKTSGERILEVLNQYVHVKDKKDAVELKAEAVKGHVRFEQVTFHYPDKEPALVDFDLFAPEGSVIGMLGATGSGKSTVIQLLLRAYNVQEGSISLDGRSIDSIKLSSLRSQIAVVFQETFLFSASIRNNIAYGNRDIAMEEIIRAAKLAQAHDFIMELPLGYDTIVGERGLGLSGGQKQRIAIARAFVKNPKILVLDDATSAVDMETEHEIQAGFKELMAGRTTFIIAHRISSLRHADEILVLDKGRIIQRGTHGELLEQTGHYRDTFDIQYMDRPDNNKDSTTDGDRRAVNG